MKQLVFATNNKHKTEEVNKLLLNQYEVLNLQDIDCDVDIPETGSTFEENASLKSSYVATHYKLDCFADDSGLEIVALNNEPGIFSARYSGNKNDLENMNLVLQKMEGVADRRACFRTVISLIHNGETFIFEGIVNGTILENPIGEQGFGYDPIFVPDGYEQSFAQMSMTQKNEISHRAIAMRKLIAFLKEQPADA